MQQPGSAMTFTTRPELQGHLRGRLVDALARLRGGHVHPREGPHGVRRRRRGRVRAAGRGAASERAGRRGPHHRDAGRRGRADRDLRPGRRRRPRRRRAFPLARARHHPRHRPSAGLHPGRVRRLADAAARLRHREPGGRARAGDLLRPDRPPAGAAHRQHDRAMRELFTTHWPSSAEIYLPGGVAPQAGGCSAIRRSPPSMARSWSGPATPASREARIQAALRLLVPRARSPSASSGSAPRRRSGTSRAAAQGPGHRAGHGGLRRRGREAAFRSRMATTRSSSAEPGRKGRCCCRCCRS